jgi:hypothetical protein
MAGGADRSDQISGLNGQQFKDILALVAAKFINRHGSVPPWIDLQKGLFFVYKFFAFKVE